LRERERIARELHDTLLQEMQGLVYKFQAAAENLPDGDSHRARLEEALDRADGVLEDGRGRVLGLRGPESESQELFAALSDAGRSLSSDRPARFHARLQGEPKPLHPIVREEVFRIAAEALTNAFNHAEADRVEMEVRYGRAALGVLVRDDGVGIQKSALAHGEGARHFGLVGMRERAANIHSRLEIFTNRGAGTEVRLLVPSVTAYRARAQAASRSWLARLTGSDTDLE
jgi:signal transduction histidine kinase